MKLLKHIVECLFGINKQTFFVLCWIQVAHAQKFPVSLHTSISTPYSAYLDDYFSENANHFHAQAIFLDYNEHDWDVKFRITLESNSLHIQTNPSLQFSAPVKVYPGVPLEINGRMLAPYFADIGKLSLAGIPASQLATNHRLPEGFYSFCLEVLDYKSGIPISQKSCSQIWISLLDEPVMLLPARNSFIQPNDPQHIEFIWQQSNAYSPNSGHQTNYILRLYELLDKQTPPINAIQNGKALNLYESEPQNVTSFVYDNSYPPLNVGKRYLYTVQAQDPSGKDQFKNNGVSEVSWFDYGISDNGRISVVQPSDKQAFTADDDLYFQWNSPDNQVSSQPLYYRLKIAPITEKSEPANAIENEKSWFEAQTPATYRSDGYELLVTETPQPLIEYAWQVTAYDSRRQVAASDVFTFRGPGVVQDFFAGEHKVKVLTTYNDDVKNLSGEGELQISKDGQIQKVIFSNIYLIRVAGRWVLDKGTIVQPLEDMPFIMLSPGKEENGKGYFYPSHLRLDKNELALKGVVKWRFPHAVSTDRDEVISTNCWVNFDTYELNGNAPLDNLNSFDLLEPSGFVCRLSPESDFLLADNRMFLRFGGAILMPESVSNASGLKKRVSFPFSGADQLFYLEKTANKDQDAIAPVSNTGIYVLPSKYVIDLSEGRSPDRFTNNPGWKGLYLAQYTVGIKKEIDAFSQTLLNKEWLRKIETGIDTSYGCWINGDGLSFIGSFVPVAEMNFNTFPSRLEKITIHIKGGILQEGYLKGSMLLPFLSEKKRFWFTSTMDEEGFRPGVVDSLDGYALDFNKGTGEQELHITFYKPVFADRERLEMSIDVAWPYLNLYLKGLNGFRLWGNYQTGFLVPNGVSWLSEQASGNVSGYPLVVNGIGAGSSSGAYSFAINGHVQMAEDVSGKSGAPDVNIYSVSPNHLLKQDGWQSTKNTMQESAKETISEETSVVNSSGDYGIVITDFVSTLQDNKFQSTVLQDVPLTIEPDTGQKKYSSPDIFKQTENIDTSSHAWASVSIRVKDVKLLHDMETIVIKALTEPFVTKINESADKLSGKVKLKVSTLTDSLHSKLAIKIELLVKKIASSLSDKVKRESFDPTVRINATAVKLIEALKIQTRESMQRSVDKNMLQPANKWLSDRFLASFESAMYLYAGDVLHVVMKGEENQEAEKVEQIAKSVTQEIFSEMDLAKLRSTLARTTEEAFLGIDAKYILLKLSSGLAADAGNIVKDALSSQPKEKINGLISSLTGKRDKNAGVFAAKAGVSLDFNNLGRHLKEGRVDKIIHLDPVNIALNTKFVSFSGTIYYAADDPTYGDIWKGGVSFTVRVPKEFTIGGTYVNGQKSGIPYWFCQISGEEKQGGSANAVLPSSVIQLKNPAELGVARLMAVSGRMYHHMTENQGSAIIPDAGVQYGAYIRMVVFDQPSSGHMIRMDISAGVQIREDGNYTIEFKGDGQFVNKVPKVLEKDPDAVGNGGISIKYNSAEDHFLGEAYLIIKDPRTVCLQAYLLVDIKPGYWRVAIGTENNKIRITPLCKGWGGAGWLDINSTTIDGGLGVTFSIYARAGFDVGIADGYVAVDAGLAAGIRASINYSPDIYLNNAGFWAEAWARVLVGYNAGLLGSGSINLVSIYVSGNMLVIFNPKPVRLKGDVKGYVEVMDMFDVDFSAGFELEV